MAVEDWIEGVKEGEGKRRANAGIVGDLFDYLSRPSRSVATATLYGLDKDPNTSVLQGIREGLLGKSQASFKDVAEQQGIGGWQGAALGFVGDVALDPLTYVGVKRVPGMSSAEAATTALRKSTISDVNIIDQEIARLQAENPAHAYATFFGRKISPSLKTTAVGKGKDVIAGKEGERRLLARAFSKKSELPFGLADSASVYESGSAAGFHNHVRDIRNVFVQNLTAEERSLISHAIERGEDLNVPVTLKPRPGFENLGDYQKLAKGIFDQYYADEVKLRILPQGGYNPNYVYRYFRNPPKDIIPGISEEFQTRPVGPNTASFAKKRVKNVTLQEAKKLGYDPVEDIAEILEIRSAKHYRTVGRAQFVNDAVERFGVKKTMETQDFLDKRGWLPVNKYVANAITDDLTDTYLPEQIVRAINATEGTLRSGTVASQFMKDYDKILREWKFLNTAVSPGYHIRNTFTDAILNFADLGARGLNPKYYSQASRILREANTDSAQALKNFIETGADAGNPLESIGSKVNIGGKNYSAREVWDMYGRSGAKAGFVSTELTNNLGELSKTGLTKYYSKVKRGVGDVSNLREDFFRLSHFLNVLDQRASKGVDIDKAISEASERVRKFNIDYTGLSSFERNTVNKVIPFYSFMRKNLPLQVELLFTKPGFMSLYPKGQDLMQGLLGTDDPDNLEGESLIPRWIRESAPVRIAMAKQEANSPLSKLLAKAAGAKLGESVFLPSLSTATPIGDINQFTEPFTRGMEEGPIAGIQEGARNVLNMVTPAIKAPVELATQQNLYTGAKIEGTDQWAQWLANQLGPSRVATQVSGITDGNPEFSPRQLVSYLSGVPLQPVTEDRQAGEFRRREDVLQNAVRSEQNQMLGALPNASALTGLTPEMISQIRRRMVNPNVLALQSYLSQLRNQATGTNG